MNSNVSLSDAPPREGVPAGPRAAGPRAIAAGLIWAGLSVAIFAGWFVVTRFSVTRDLGVWDVTALRFGVGAVLLSPALIRPSSRPPPAAWRQGFLFALLWGAPFVLLLALGLQRSSAAQAASTTPTTMPIFAGLFAFAFFGELPGRTRIAGYAAILAGLIGLMASGAAAGSRPDPLGLFCLLAAAAGWAGYTLLFRRSRLNGLQAAALICFWSTVLLLPVYLLFGLSRLGQASAQEIALQAGYQGVLVSGGALLTFNRAVALIGAAAASAIMALVPAVAAALAIPFLGEIPSLSESAAIAAIVLGVMLASRPARR